MLPRLGNRIAGFVVLLAAVTSMIVCLAAFQKHALHYRLGVTAGLLIMAIFLFRLASGVWRARPWAYWTAVTLAVLLLPYALATAGRGRDAAAVVDLVLLVGLVLMHRLVHPHRSRPRMPYTRR